MEKKTECEIVQDLLIGYVDGVLNKESKKLVESHLLDCKKCQERVAEIKAETQKEENQQKKEIDYLKKIRMKSRIKSVLLAILILGMIFVSWYLYKFCILSSIAKKIEKQFESENFYIETVSSLGFEEDGIMISKTWYKDGKYKKISYIENEEKILQKFDTEYGNIANSAREDYLINEEEKKVTKEKWFFDKSKNDFIVAPNPIHLSNNPHYIIFRLGAPFYTKISTDHEKIGRLYYVLELDHGKQWVDMDTGLPIMSFGYSSVTDYYKDTKIPKRYAESISEYHYEFETVTDEDVEMPDLEEYEWEEYDWQKEVDRALEEKK